MAGTTSDSAVGKFLEGTLSGEALAEWRSSEQVENGIASTSPPYWDTDDEEDCGPKPSDMYGHYTWKIDKFSQINKRELRSNSFEVGSYKWYILIYPQGCDVCNHLSVFLCVADHDKLLPGWSHFAQFTIAVINKDPKKSKYSDTLHRFWKKEHDWGWKKFMELSKVLAGFVDDDQLTIKAQVQVIREKPDRPFRCLDSRYRRVLVGIYLTNVEQIYRRFVEERRNKLVQLREDKARWSSFRAFWIAIDQNTRRHMCREKADAILRAIVKQFFMEKEVTSTLVMDSLYSGLRALEGQSKDKVGSKEILNAGECPVPIVHVEDDMFVLMDDVLKLFGRASMEPLPPKDGKGPQNRMNDGCLEDCSKNFNELSERRLTELGRRTIEIFVLAHIFGKIEVAYQEADSLRRQEELIREEAVWLAEIEQRVKRGVSEKEKKLKKKQAKQKRNDRKGKDKGKTEKSSAAIEDDLQPDSSSDDKLERMADVVECLFSKINKPEDIVDVSDSVSCLPELRSPGSEERDDSWDIDALEIHPPTYASSSSVSGHSVVQRGTLEKNNPSLVDDSLSTCSTDSVPSVVTNDLYSGYSLPKQRNRKSLNSIKNQRGTATIIGVGYYDSAHNQQPEATSGASKLIAAGGSGKAESQSKVAALSLNGRKIDEHHMAKKEKVVSSQWESIIRGQAVEDKLFKEKRRIVTPSLSTPSQIMSSTVPVKPESKISGSTNPIAFNKPFSVSPAQAERATSVINKADSTDAVKLEAHKVIPKKPTSKPSAHLLPVVSRPLSAPVVPGPKPSAPIVSYVQTPPVLSRSMSAAGCLVLDTSPSYLPLSYKNATMGITQSHSPVSSLNPSESYTQLSNSPSSSCDPSQLHKQVSLSLSSAFYPSQSHTQVSHSPCSPLYPSQLHTQVSHSHSSSFNPLQSHTQVSHSPSLLLYPSQSHLPISRSPTSSFNPVQLYSQKSSFPIFPLDPSNSQTQTPNAISASLSFSLSPERIEPISLKPSNTFGVVNQNEKANSPGLVNTSQTRSQERLSHSGLGDDFPHLDIINNLLDEEKGFWTESLHGLSMEDPGLSRHVNFPFDISGMSPELVAASTSYCRFDQDYYEDGYQLGYGSLVGHFDSLDLGYMIPQINPGLYVNEPIDALIQNQWPMNSGDVSYYSRTNAEVDSYPYNFLENANLSCSVMDYTAFGPSNAH